MKLSSSQLYINRELSWLEFNDRVLQEGLHPETPPLERMKFLAIVSSNLDEFFMIRVAGLKQAQAAGVRRKDPAGLTPATQLTRVKQRVRRMIAEQSEGIAKLTEELAGHGFVLLERDAWDPKQRAFLRDYFADEVEPTLTPMAVEAMDPKPLLPALRLCVAVRVRQADADEAQLVILPVPTVLSRFVALPAEAGLQLARLEDVVLDNVARLYRDQEIVSSAVFRITRDNDVAVEDDENEDLLENIDRAIRERIRRQVVRLEISADAPKDIRRGLMELFEVTAGDVYEIRGMLDAKAMMGVALRPGFEALKDESWLPQTPRDLIGSDDLYATLREKDVLLVHPYESFEPVVDLLTTAAEDPDVLAIKQTLYRTTGDSPVVKALLSAAENGKQVTVLVELKARFDEARNVGWARRLEDAGADVIYGIAGLKTHAKMLLIVRREDHGVRRYVHLATGNYNDQTAKLYSDIGLMTTDRDLAADVAAFFNLLTGSSQIVGWHELAIAPTDLRRRVIEMIDREIQVSTPQQPGLILAKVNSLQDPEIIRALYRASQAGVQIKLNVRGICCLRPGVEGVSENIEVLSIIDRYLEHARIFYFRNGGHEEVYLSSADWMVRNLDKRLETLFPVSDPRLAARCVEMLDIYFADNVKARRLGADGLYTPVKRKKRTPPRRSQQILHDQAVEAVTEARQRQLQFRPRRRKR